MAFKIKDGIRIGITDVFNNSAETLNLKVKDTNSGSGVVTINTASLSTTSYTQTLQAKTGTIALTSDLITYDQLAVTTTGGAFLRLHSSTGVNDDVKFASGTNVTVTYTDDNTITISSTDTNTDTLQSIANDTANAERFITFVANATGAQTGLSSANIKFNPTTGLTLGGDIAVNGGDITTTAATGAVFNTNATTLNIGGVATAINAGISAASASTLTFGPAITGNTFKIKSIAAGTVNLTSDVTSGTVNLYTGVVTNGTINIGGTGSSIVVAGNLTVKGTTTTVESETLVVNDNIIVLNNNVTEAPTENSGIEVERGTSANVSVLWNETNDRWTITNDGTNYYNILVAGDFGISTETGADAYSEKIRLSVNGTTDDIILAVAQTETVYGLTISESGDTITFAHADTSTITGAQGTAGIASITIDGMGHVTAVTTATYLTSQSNDFGVVKIDNTDTEYTWVVTDATTTSADALADTLTVVAAKTGSTYGIQVKIDATNDALGIAHADTSTLSGAQGTAGIASITVDEMGHVTAVTTATYLTSQSTDFKTITVSDTDTGYTWADTGSAVAEAVGDTLTVVSGKGVDVDVDATNDAIRITTAGSDYAYSEALTVTVASPTANTAFNLDSWTKANFRAVKYIIGVVQGTVLYQTSEIMVFNDGSTGQMTEYAVFSNDATKEVTYTIDFSGATAYLKAATPTATTGITFKIHRTLIAI